MIDVEWLRDLPVTPDGQLSEVQPHIFMSEGGVAEHIDQIGEGLMVYGLVLLNDAGLIMRHGNGLMALPVGSIYIIDPTVPHSTFPDVPTPGQRLAVYVEYHPLGKFTAAQFKSYAEDKVSLRNLT